jgi:hypothetical protein
MADDLTPGRGYADLAQSYEHDAPEEWCLASNSLSYDIPCLGSSFLSCMSHAPHWRETGVLVSDSLSIPDERRFVH